jgi:hypothetical protein
MNELDILRRAGLALDPPAGPPDALRQRVLDGFTARTSSRRRRSRRWNVAIAAGVAAAVLLAVALVAGPDRSHRYEATPERSFTWTPPTTPPPSTTGPPPSPLPSKVFGAREAQQFLRAVATAARDQPPPRPDQYIHLETISVRIGRPTPSEFWISVDGTRANYTEGWVTAYFFGCRNGVLMGPNDQPGDRASTSCTTKPGIRGDLPTTVAGMRQLIASKGLTELMLEIFLQPTPTLLPPATSAVLFEALAQTPGATLVQPILDAAGRQGVAASWNHAGSTLRLVFDPTTHEYLAIQIMDPGQTTPQMQNCIVRYEYVDSLPTR